MLNQSYRYVGAAVLNLAKVIMYDFHYGFLMKKFPRAQLLFTDTGILDIFQLC